MSTDRVVTENLLEVLQDGKDGYEHAAQLLEETEQSDLSLKFNHYATQRAQFAAELQQMAAEYGDYIYDSGSAKATAHRVWMTVKDKLTGSDPETIIDVAHQGEEYAVAQFEEAAGEEISPTLRDTVERHLGQIKIIQSELTKLRAAA